jgi:hypothetical protein
MFFFTLGVDQYTIDDHDNKLVQILHKNIVHQIHKGTLHHVDLSYLHLMIS